MRRLTVVVLAALGAVVGWGAEGNAAGDAAAGAGEELPELEGVVIERPTGMLATVTMEGPFLLFKFFDEKHQPVKADVARGFVRAVPAGRRPERVTLSLAEDGMALRAVQPIRPPHVFRLFVTFSQSAGGGEEDGTESYQVGYP